jgi:hypothetical protein
MLAISYVTRQARLTEKRTRPRKKKNGRGLVREPVFSSGLRLAATLNGMLREFGRALKVKLFFYVCFVGFNRFYA